MTGSKSPCYLFPVWAIPAPKGETPIVYQFNCWTTYEVAMGIPEEAAAQMMGLTYYYYYDVAAFDTVKGPSSFRIDHQLTGKYLAFLVKGKPASQRKDKYADYS